MTGSFPANVLWAPVASFAITWIVIVGLLHAFSDRIMDYPNERSLHHRPVPRTGGIGVVAGVALSAPFISIAEWWPIWFGAALIVGISLLDDIIGLPVILRLLVHFVATGGAAAGFLLNYPGIGWILAIVVIVWMTNLYNFMDGIDGLAGGMALFGFGFYAIAGVLNSHLSFALINAAIAAAAGAFLLFNFYPARIFMGDAGSTFLGFLAACLGLVGWQSGIWTVWFPGLVFSPFIVDATVTLARRLLRRNKIWRPHREHYYQKLVLAGWGHRRTAIVEYGLMLVCGSVALVFEHVADTFRFVGVVLLAIGFFVLTKVVHTFEQKTEHGASVRGR